jgi:hypothetical protein
VLHSWVLTAAKLFAFTAISEAFGMYTMFFIFAGINLFGVLATLVLLPETNGKTIEEIEEILDR